MRRLITVTRDEGDGGGGDRAPNADPGSQAANTDANAASTSAQDGDKTGSGDDAKNTGDNQTQTVESLTAELKQVKSKLGQQGNELGNYKKESTAFRKIVANLKTNPDEALLKLAKEYGGTVKVGNQNDEIDKALLSDDPEARAKILKARELNQTEQNTEAKVMSRLNPIIDHLLEESMARKYPDYEELADDRQHLQTMLDGGALPPPELFHYAARGMNIEGALKDAKAEGIAEYKTMLDKKAQGQLDTSGDKPGDKSEMDFGDVAFILSDKF